MARQLLERAGEKLVLPWTASWRGEAKPGARTWLLDRDAVPPEGMILDIGPKTVATFREFVDRARTVLWNGPMGMSEIEEFATAPLASRARSPTRRSAGRRPSWAAATAPPP